MDECQAIASRAIAGNTVKVSCRIAVELLQKTLANLRPNRFSAMYDMRQYGIRRCHRPTTSMVTRGQKALLRKDLFCVPAAGSPDKYSTPPFLIGKGRKHGAVKFLRAVTRIVPNSPLSVATLSRHFGSCFFQLLEIRALFVEFSVAVTKAARFRFSAAVSLLLI